MTVGWLSVLMYATEALAVPLDPADYSSLGTLAPPGPITIDTDVPQITGATSFTGVLDGNVAVFTFDAVQIDDLVRVVGQHPLAILSHGTLVVGPSGVIDASARDWAPGPGGFE